MILKGLAATYSRGSYTTTTIGKTVFDGRVRNGNGSDHCFMATKIIETGGGASQGLQPPTLSNFKRACPNPVGPNPENYTQGKPYNMYNSRVEKRFSGQGKKQSSRTTD